MRTLSERPKGVRDHQVPVSLYQPIYHMDSPEIEPGLSRSEIDGGRSYIHWICCRRNILFK